MPYFSNEEVKKKVYNYLERAIKTAKKVDIRALTLDSIIASLKHIDKKEVINAINKLEEEEKIVRVKSNLELYIPSDLINHKKLKPFKLGDPTKTIKISYIIGISLMSIIFYLSPSFRAEMLQSFDFHDPKNIIPNSILLGFVIPMFLGYLSYDIYQRTLQLLTKKMSPVHIRILKFSTIVFGIIMFLRAVFGYFFAYMPNMNEIYAILALTVAITGVYASLIKNKYKTKLKKRGVRK